MTKVPFDYEVFKKNKVVLQFLCGEHIEIFENTYYSGYRYSEYDLNEVTYEETISKVPYYECFRFINGKWVNMGSIGAYTSSLVKYDDYLHMVFDPSLANCICVEVEDLI